MSQIIVGLTPETSWKYKEIVFSQLVQRRNQNYDNIMVNSQKPNLCTDSERNKIARESWKMPYFGYRVVILPLFSIVFVHSKLFPMNQICFLC